MTERIKILFHFCNVYEKSMSYVHVKFACYVPNFFFVCVFEVVSTQHILYIAKECFFARLHCMILVWHKIKEKGWKRAIVINSFSFSHRNYLSRILPSLINSAILSCICASFRKLHLTSNEAICVLKSSFLHSNFISLR